MDPALGLHVDVVEGEVHQHRFAAPDPAPQIDAGGPAARLAEQPRQQAAVLRNAGREAIERRDRARLRRIGFQLARRDQRGIGRPVPVRSSAGRLGLFTRFKRAGEAVAGLAVLLDHALQEGVAARSA